MLQQNIWNVAKYLDKGVCRCYASMNLFWRRKIYKLSCLIKSTTNPFCVWWWWWWWWGYINKDACYMISTCSRRVTNVVCFTITGVSVELTFTDVCLNGWINWAHAPIHVQRNKVLERLPETLWEDVCSQLFVDRASK